MNGYEVPPYLSALVMGDNEAILSTSALLRVSKEDFFATSALVRGGNEALPLHQNW